MVAMAHPSRNALENQSGISLVNYLNIHSPLPWPVQFNKKYTLPGTQHKFTARYRDSFAWTQDYSFQVGIGIIIYPVMLVKRRWRYQFFKEIQDIMTQARLILIQDNRGRGMAGTYNTYAIDNTAFMNLTLNLLCNIYQFNPLARPDVHCKTSYLANTREHYVY